MILGVLAVGVPRGVRHGRPVGDDVVGGEHAPGLRGSVEEEQASGFDGAAGMVDARRAVFRGECELIGGSDSRGEGEGIARRRRRTAPRHGQLRVVGHGVLRWRRGLDGRRVGRGRGCGRRAGRGRRIGRRRRWWRGRRRDERRVDVPQLELAELTDGVVAIELPDREQELGFDLRPKDVGILRLRHERAVELELDQGGVHARERSACDVETLSRFRRRGAGHARHESEQRESVSSHGDYQVWPPSGGGGG